MSIVNTKGLTKSKIANFKSAKEIMNSSQPQTPSATFSEAESTSYFANLGYDLMEESNDEIELGTSAGTLHFVNLLGLASKPTVRKEGDKNIPCPTTIGVTLISDKPITVPDIDPRKNKDTGIDVNWDISSRKVPKGKPFNLNMYELMYLIIRPEYAGFLTYNGDPQAVYFAPKKSKFLKGEALLPTPALAFRLGLGSIKENMIAIDEKVNGVWQAKPEYKAEFGELFSNEKARKAKIKEFPTQTAIAVGLHSLLYGDKLDSTL